jgi:hypothetical protein
MRNRIILVATTATLAACSGSGPQTVGGNASPSSPTATHTFVNPTEKRTYNAIGGTQKYQYYTTSSATGPNTQPLLQSGQFYAGNASTARNSGITISYDPRDAIFELTINDPLSGVDNTLRFQDPVHRTNFGGASQPQGGTPQLSAGGINYLEAGSSTGNVVYDTAQSTTFPVGAANATRDVSTFFYQKPGTETSYVTFAGYVRNSTTVASVQDNVGADYLRQNNQLERAAFAYGERTNSSAVPLTGTGSYSGAMLASAVYNPSFDVDPSTPTYFQWIEGRATTTVDFAAKTFTLGLTGTVFAPQFDANTSRTYALQQGASFAAAGSGQIDLVNAGGFLGKFNSASFTQPGGQKLTLDIAGSSIDGAFFGPTAQEVGGGFRVVGGVPDQRVDILGAFVGKKQ